MKAIPILGMFAVVLGLAACSSTPTQQASSAPKGGGYYLDDGPEANPPGNLDKIPDAVPRQEPLHRYANRTYVVLGNTYHPQTTAGAYRKEGVASWYGKRFNGKKTASGEKYDMYAMTAAHPTLPIPSYARVTALNSGKSVVVRINDRGPFHSKRIIDLSYAAAHKLGYIRQGSTRVRVESIDPDTYAVQDDAPGQGGYLQVGVFSRADNAEQLLDRLAREFELDAARARVVSDGALHRVQVGPYRNDDVANADRLRVRERLALNAVLVRRD
jgi:rare lipoprotein A